MKALFGALVTTVTMSIAAAEDWPHWRGPTRDGISGETGLPTEWSTTKNVAWRIPMPDRSGAAPIISGETIFLNVAENDLEIYTLSSVAVSQGQLFMRTEDSLYCVGQRR